MNAYIQVNPGYHERRWVTYLDLLGFAELVRTEDWVNIFSKYAPIIERYTREDLIAEPTIEQVWFSDTFLLYSPDDTILSFTAIDRRTRAFVEFLVSEGIPVRGAISCDDLYADKQNNIFFGKALLEAYHYGENQNWIGLILTPSSVEQLATIGLPAERQSGYACWNIPYKRLVPDLARTLPACILGGSTLGCNTCLDELHKMKTRCEGTAHITKYENAISFIEWIIDRTVYHSFL
jgi:hypothetical protein